MKKNTFRTNINEVKQTLKTIPSMNEAIDGEYGDVIEPEMEEDEPMPVEEPEPEMAEKETPEQLIDDIRKKALRAMAELADTPESPSYQTLKKIWQMCDKKPEDEKKKEF